MWCLGGRGTSGPEGALGVRLLYFPFGSIVFVAAIGCGYQLHIGTVKELFCWSFDLQAYFSAEDALALGSPWYTFGPMPQRHYRAQGALGPKGPIPKAKKGPRGSPWLSHGVQSLGAKKLQEYTSTMSSALV